MPNQNGTGELKRLCALFANASVGFSVTDGSGRFVRANNAFLKISGYSRQELTRTNYQSVTHPDDLLANIRLAHRLYAAEISDAVYQKRYITKSGEIRWVRNSVTVLNDSKGRLANVVALTEDITEWRNSRRAVKTGNDRTRRLVEHMRNDELSERRRIAVELEGSTAELMAAIALRLLKLKESSALNEAENHALSEGVALAGRFIYYMGALAHILSPSTSDSPGFQDMLSEYVRVYTARTGIAVRVEFSGSIDALRPTTAAAAFSAAKRAMAEFLFYPPVSGVAMSVRREGTLVIVEVEGDATKHGCESIEMARLRHEIKCAGGCAQFSLSSGRARFRAVIPDGDIT